MTSPDKPTLPTPTASEYIQDNFKPDDRIAVLVLNRQRGETTQRITTAQKASSPEFQAWLRYKNANGADIYVGMNALRHDASTRTKDDIEKIKGYIANNKAGYLYKFYHECFSSGEQKELSIFKKGLMKDYLEEMTVDALIAGLDYLKSAELDTGKLKTVKTRFIHGEDDSIAPIEGVLALKNELPGSKLVILRNVGHIPFLRSDFKAFYGRQDI